WEDSLDYHNFVGFSPDGRTVVACSTGSVLLRSADTGELLHRLDTEGHLILAHAFAADSKRLATATASVGKTGHALRVWDVASAPPRQALAGPERMVTAVAFAADGRRLVTCADINPGLPGKKEVEETGTVRVWDLAGGRKHEEWPVGKGGVLSADGTVLAYAS